MHKTEELSSMHVSIVIKLIHMIIGWGNLDKDRKCYAYAHNAEGRYSVEDSDVIVLSRIPIASFNPRF